MARSILLSILILCSLLSKAQIHNLVFEGAGIRGIAYGGAIQELERQDKLKDVQRFGGTSAGAITAVLLSFGYSGHEIDSIISSTRFQRFNDGRYLFFGGLYRFGKFFGWYKGDRFEKWMGQLIEAKSDNSNITFKQAHDLGYKDVYLTATSLSQQRSLILSFKTYPDMKIKDAVRISMSIPLYYKAIFINSKGELFDRQNKKGDLNVVVDGGILMNFPIGIFDSVYTSNGQTKRMPDTHTLGIRIDNDDQIKQDANGHRLAEVHIRNIADYISAFYTITLEQLNRQSLTADDWKRTIQVSSKGIGPKVKKLNQKQKSLLVESGREAVRKYFTQE